MCNFIYDILISDTFWTALGSIATCVIGFFAYKISAEQYLIEKYKKDDFLYDRRLNLYKELYSLLYSFLKEWHQAEIKIEELRKYQERIVEVTSTSKFLFNDEKIEKVSDNLLKDMCEVSQKHLSDRKRALECIDKIEKCFLKLPDYFAIYLNLMSKKD